MAVTANKLTYTKNPSSPSSLKIFPIELSTPLGRQDGEGHPVEATIQPYSDQQVLTGRGVCYQEDPMGRKKELWGRVSSHRIVLI